MTDCAELPTVSVIIPVFNGGDDLELCLAAISRSECAPLECIVVDDGSTDGRTADIAARHGARLVEMERQSGPAAARNRGAGQATGEVLFFTDADVEVHADTLYTGLRALAADADLAAVFGSYDEHPAHPGFLSRYRNLYHHWNHQQANPEASTFWTGCGMVRRDVFLATGGFNADYARPSIEDIEFGYRLKAAGHRIGLLRDMQCTHRKEWTLAGMLKTDLFQRGIPWVVLLKRFPEMPPDLNINLGARVATLLAGVIVLFGLLLIPGHPASLALWPWLVVPLLALVGIAWIQRDFLRLVHRLHGPAFALAVIPFLALFFISCGSALVLGSAVAAAGRSRESGC